MKRPNSNNRLTKLAYQKPTTTVFTVVVPRLMADSYDEKLGPLDDDNEITNGNDII